MNKVYDAIIIGGGLVGLSVGYQILQRDPTASICILEKETEAAFHQSGRNSGVIHSGIYYKPGSFRAKNCMEGRKLLIAFAQENNIEHDVCGKIILQVSENEHEKMLEIFQRGIENGLEKLQIIDVKEIQAIEPFAKGLAAIWVPQAGIIHFKQVANKLVEIINVKKSNVSFNAEVINITHRNDIFEIKTTNRTFSAHKLINCAGLQSDRIAILSGENIVTRVVPFRGDYYELCASAKYKVKNLIYPVPNPEFPFLGVHLTRMTTGIIECGPNAVLSLDREGYSKTAIRFQDMINMFGYIGTWKFLKKHWQHGIMELRRAFSKQRFLNELRRLVPCLEMQDIMVSRSGIRAMVLMPDGSFSDDFIWQASKNAIHVLNAPSPAATACLSIGKTVAEKAGF